MIPFFCVCSFFVYHIFRCFLVLEENVTLALWGSLCFHLVFTFFSSRYFQDIIRKKTHVFIHLKTMSMELKSINKPLSNTYSHRHHRHHHHHQYHSRHILNLLRNICKIFYLSICSCGSYSTLSHLYYNYSFCYCWCFNSVVSLLAST